TAREWIGSIVESVAVLCPGVGLKHYTDSDLPWAYRRSGLPLGEIVCECSLRVKPGNVSQIRAKMEGSLTRRRKSQPLTLPSAGSVFRNPEGVSAGQLIEQLGLKGYRVGGAAVSTLHANFIVNDKGATAADVLAIIKHIRQRVKEEYGYELQPEIRFIGFE
ncbi:MAG: UDP-N-acetylenolpyruvoylglucosamine reductase, partial [Coriobacteriales bacterium]|nr:UDP-N-acetylenolpyruvoylglucosamine reductase [Coriobacteriales bacterium]